MFVVVAELRDEQHYWHCKLCGLDVVVPAYDPSGRKGVLDHLYKKHGLASLLVGYTWIGYGEENS